jgi:ectoine hydroxylase-related dioxygenase (phytanoyl-CoA dioxygenase family)
MYLESNQAKQFSWLAGAASRLTCHCNLSGVKLQSVGNGNQQFLFLSKGGAMVTSRHDLQRDYAQNGFVVLRSVVSLAALDAFEGKILDYLAALSGRRLETVRGPEFAQLLSSDRELERKLYDGVRREEWLQEFMLHPCVTKPVLDLLGESIGLLEKIPLRVDLPLVTRELAVWHQDHFYVKGNTDIVTLWMPLQDTRYAEGCLMVMPGSHKQGIITHDSQALGKRDYPSHIFDNMVRYVEMQRGDVLLFHSLLLHSSGVNISDRARLSIQARYSGLGSRTDEAMGNLIPIKETAQ